MRAAGRGFGWLGLHDPDEAELAGRFDLHPLAVEDTVPAEHQRPKLDRYEDMLFAVLKTVRYVHPHSRRPTSRWWRAARSASSSAATS